MRLWKESLDDDSVHVLGNGRMCVYEQGPSVMQVFGPPYSAPTMLASPFVLPEGFTGVLSERRPGTAVWEHTAHPDSPGSLVIRDFVDAELPCFCRSFRSTVRLSLPLHFPKAAAVQDNSPTYADKNCSSAVLALAVPGAYVYGRYPSSAWHYLQVLCQGAAFLQSEPGAGWRLIVEPGEGSILMASGSSYPDMVTTAEAALDVGTASMEERTLREWHRFTARRRDVSSSLPANLPRRDELLAAVDSTAVLIKAQQAVEGGVLAGYNYHLGYVRDQYGVSRCLLRLGCYTEARAILSFYWQVWQRHGMIRNAQGMGVEGLFHEHENDAVEITGYLLVQAFDYLQETGDAAFIEEILPMLLWAFDAQTQQLIDGMLPFNGDETYVAGGILPRTALHDGSAEATLLYVTGGEALLHWLTSTGRARQRAYDTDAMGQGLERVKAAFPERFIRDNQLLTNNPSRRFAAVMQRFRHGVCEACLGRSDSEITSFGWTERTEQGRYVCPLCRGRAELERPEAQSYVLQSVSLIPTYIGSSLVDRPLLRRTVEGLLEAFLHTGTLPSRPDGGRTVGYDYGLLLYSAVKLGVEGTQPLYEAALDLVDSAGAWVEYYDHGQPASTRCRPWESGINLEALLEFAYAW